MQQVASRLAIALILVATAVPVFGQDEVTVQATGNGTTPNEALADAQRKAVEQGAGVIIESKSQTENFVLVMDQIYSESKGFITSYRELSKGQDRATGLFTITIQATVSKKQVEDSLAQYELMMKRIGRPKIMTMFRTRVNGRDLEDQRFIISLEKPLEEAMFTLIDKKSFDESKQLLLAEANLKDDIGAMTRLAKDTGADLLIRGDITCTEHRTESYPGIPAKVNFQWNFQYRIVRTNDSSILCVYSRDATVRPDKRILPEDANFTADRVLSASGQGEGYRTGREARTMMMAKWAFQAQNRTTFNLVIKNSEFSDGDALVEWLRAQQDWVSDVFLDGFEDNVTKVRVDSKLPKNSDVASRLSRGGAGMPIKLKVTGLNAGTISCEVVGR